MSRDTIPAFFVVAPEHGAPPIFVTRGELFAQPHLINAVLAQLERQARELDEAARQKRLIATALAEPAEG
jgi:hypothetical protein